MSDMDTYQEATKSTAIYPPEAAIEYLVLGLASEAGEVAGKLKKLIRDPEAMTKEEWRKVVISEMGDVLWYIARLADELDTPLSEVALENLNKLLSRKERGMLGGSGDNR